MNTLLREAQNIGIKNDQSSFDIDSRSNQLEGARWAEEHYSHSSRNIHTPLPSKVVDKQWSDEYCNGNTNFIQDPFRPSSNFYQFQNPSNIMSTHPQSKWAQEYLEETDWKLVNQKHLLDNNWSQEFSSSSSDLQQEARKFVDSIKNDEKLNETEFVDFMRKIRDNQINLSQNEAKENRSEIWAQEFSKAASVWQDNAIQSDKEFWDGLAHEWEESDTKQDLETNDHTLNPNFWVDEFEKSKPYINNEYNFTQDNPYKEMPNAFEEGLNKLKANDIPSAVLLFEAACQQNPDNPLHWQFLGTSQAQNEHDSSAIKALTKCIEFEPSNLTALMGLSVSYTNKGLTDDASDTLKQWLACNPKYSSIVSTKKNLSQVSSQDKFKHVKDMYLQAARLFPNSPDADLQCGLGVLLNLSGEYDKAADCFKAALQVRPNDCILWNRLGATLANGNKSEEAIAAYREALALSPGFIRSRFNLGISCINLGAYREAAEHFLIVLNLQNSGRGLNGQKSAVAMSNNVWTSLRLVISLMNRQDLHKYVDRRDLNNLNREFKMNA